MFIEKEKNGKDFIYEKIIYDIITFSHYISTLLFTIYRT